MIACCLREHGVEAVTCRFHMSKFALNIFLVRDLGSPLTISACTISATGRVSEWTSLVSSVADPLLMEAGITSFTASTLSSLVASEVLPPYIYIYIYTEQKYKCNNFVFAPIFHELNSKTFSMYTKGLFLSNIVHKSV